MVNNIWFCLRKNYALKCLIILQLRDIPLSQQITVLYSVLHISEDKIIYRKYDYIT